MGHSFRVVVLRDCLLKLFYRSLGVPQAVCRSELCGFRHEKPATQLTPSTFGGVKEGAWFVLCRDSHRLACGLRVAPAIFRPRDPAQSRIFRKKSSLRQPSTVAAALYQCHSPKGWLPLLSSRFGFLDLFLLSTYPEVTLQWHQVQHMQM